MGKGCLKAVKNINDIIAPALLKANIDVTDQKVRMQLRVCSTAQTICALLSEYPNTSRFARKESVDRAVA